MITDEQKERHGITENKRDTMEQIIDRLDSLESKSGWLVGPKAFFSITGSMITGIATAVFIAAKFWFQVQGMEVKLKENQNLLNEVVTRQQGVLQKLQGVDVSLAVLSRQMDRLEVMHQKP